VDLTQLTRGYTNNSPVYAILGFSNGSVSVLAGTTAHFVPSVATDSLGSFSFSVTGAAGDSMTNEVGIHISTTVAPPQVPVLGLRTDGAVVSPLNSLMSLAEKQNSER
jgi:hypothetical protein